MLTLDVGGQGAIGDTRPVEKSRNDGRLVLRLRMASSCTGRQRHVGASGIEVDDVDGGTGHLSALTKRNIREAGCWGLDLEENIARAAGCRRSWNVQAIGDIALLDRRGLSERG